jgi:hypothetical protein
MNERAELFRRMSVAARKQHNFTVADKFLRLSLKAKDNKKEFDFDFFHALVKLHCLKAHHTKHEVDAIDKFTKALKFLQDKQNEPIITTNINIKIKFLMLRGRVCEALYRYALQYPYQVVDCFNTNQITQILCQSPTEKVIDASNIASALRTFTLHTYDGLIQLHKQQQQQQHSDSSSKVVFIFCFSYVFIFFIDTSFYIFTLFVCTHFISLIRILFECCECNRLPQPRPI